MTVLTCLRWLLRRDSVIMIVEKFMAAKVAVIHDRQISTYTSYYDSTYEITRQKETP